MHEILLGLADAFTVTNMLYVAAGVLIGQAFAAAPGVSALVALTIAVPFTFYLSPITAIGFLIGINKGGTLGGSVAAILMNTPGSPESTATTFDGYPMALRGQGLKALKTSHVSSVSGDAIGDLVLFLVSVPLAYVAMKMGPLETASVVLVAFVVLGALVGNSVLKGLIAAAFGVLLSMVGTDPETAGERLSFGIPELMDGLSISAVGIGILALGEIFRQAILYRNAMTNTTTNAGLGEAKNNRFGWSDFRHIGPTILRSSGIGVLIGAIPGPGSTAAAFISYAAAKRSAKNPDDFGKGDIRGVAATESANTAVTGASFIPLLSIGIPGNLAAALILGGFVIHGITPGPQLFTDHTRLIYGIFGAMIIGTLCNLLFGLFTLRLFAKVIRMPLQIVLPCVVLLSVTGIIISSNFFSAWLVIGFAALGFMMRTLDFSFVTFIIGFILGPMFELNVRQSVLLADGNLGYLLDRPIALAFILLAIVLTWRLAKNRKAGSPVAI